MPDLQKILVIEDDQTIRDVLRLFLTGKGFDVVLAQNGEEGLDLLRTDAFSLILTDVVMPGISGMDILRVVAGSRLNIPVIVMTAFGSIAAAVQAMRSGAFDYIAKPFNLDELSVVIDKALSLSRLQQENVMLRMQLRKKYHFEGLIGDSQPMQEVYALIEKVADTDSTVLITGESGTGKERIARTIHFNNRLRAQCPFVPLNCAAIPHDLLASELFGHEKGSFTGAVSTRIGRFELAQGGTLFLDEVDELDPALQSRLLRVLQEREFERVGGVKTIQMDCRIVAATNRDLEQAVREGAFREDLFYRLNVIPIRLPPLRSRPEDIVLLSRHFIEEFCRKRTRAPFVFSQKAMDCLLAYPWPGNVRELENLIERLSILVPAPVVEVADLPERLVRHLFSEGELNVNGGGQRTAGSAGAELGAGVVLPEVIENLERQLIEKALQQADGVKAKAAVLLGLNRTTLVEKMKKLGITGRTA